MLIKEAQYNQLNATNELELIRNWVVAGCRLLPICPQSDKLLDIAICFPTMSGTRTQTHIYSLIPK